MRRFLLTSPTALVSFLLGLIAAVALTVQQRVPVTTIPPERFDVYLEIIQVKDEDPSRWNIDGGYLAMYDAVLFDDKNILALYLQDGLRMSHDGGKSWERLFEPGGIPKATGGFTLQSLEFLDSKTGWAGGSCLISTQDGGVTWKKLTLPEWMDNIKVKFLNEKFGYVAGRAGFCNRDGERCNTSLTVYKTTNGGKSWQKSYSDKQQSTPWEIKILDEEVALILGNGNNILRTQNSGKSWKKVYERDYGGSKSIAVGPDGRLWIFGNKNILTSDDLGRTWHHIDSIADTIVNHDWWSVDFTEEGLGVAVSEESAIAITRDGGLSWRQVSSNLHVKDKIPVPNNPFDEQLQGIRLRGKKGIVMGGQRNYLITIPDKAD